MKLSSEQIEQLYQFTRKHYVEWYDLQNELVDHLANGIEQQWQTNSNISFEDALQKEFKKFGVFGFMTVVEKRQKALSKKYWKIMWSFIKEWFKLPKIIATITVTYILFLFFEYGLGRYIFIISVVTLGIYVFYRVKKLKQNFKNRFKETGKKWLFEEMIFVTATSNSMLFVVNLFNFFNLSEFTSNFTNGVFSVLTMLMVLVSFITLEVIPKNAEKYLKDIYPEYNLV